MNGSAWLFAGFVFLLAGGVKGIVGMGLPTIAMGLLSLAFAPAQAAALLVVPSLVTNVWQLFAGRGLPALAVRLWSMMAGVVAGTLASTGFLTEGGSTMPTLALGIALMLYAGIGLAGWKPAVSRRHEAWLSPLVGMTTGLVTGATGVFVLPAVPYLQAIGLEKDGLVQALGLSFTVSTLALAAGLLAAGTLPAGSAGLSLVLLLPALAGMGLGQAVRRRIAASTFRWIFFVGLLFLGTYLVIRQMA